MSAPVSARKSAVFSYTFLLHFMQRLLIIPLTAMTLVSGCKKEEEKVPALEGRYHAGSTIKAGVLQLCVAQRVITDPAIIAKFMRRHWRGAALFMRRDTTAGERSSITVDFEQGNRVILRDPFFPGANIVNEVTSRTAQRYVLSQIDSIQTRSGPSSGIVATCEAMPARVREFSPAQRCVPVPSLAGVGKLCRFRPLRVLALRNGRPYVPLLSWYSVSGTPSYFCYTGFGLEINTPNVSLPRLLGIGDSVLVQLNELELVR